MNNRWKAHMRVNNSLRLTVFLGLMVFMGCGILGSPPDVIAERFWDASMDGDFERAAEYVTASSVSLLERNADNAPEVEEVALGDVKVDGDDATIRTTMTAMFNEKPIEVEFDTVLEKEDGRWKVDLRATTGQMISQFIGQSAGEVMGQIGEALGEQMRGMFDGMMQGLAEGMQQAGQALQDARPDSSGAD